VLLTKGNVLIGELTPSLMLPEHPTGDSAIDDYLRVAGDDPDRPSDKTIDRGRGWLRRLAGLLAAFDPGWIAPNVSAGADGELVLEWWNGQRKVTVYLDEEETEYVRSWGTSIEDDMDDGTVADPSRMANIWNWLHSDVDDV